MIEIGFGHSVTGSLMAAQAYNGLFKENEKNTVIIQMNFLLDIGYIDNEITSAYRMSIPEKLYTFHEYDDDVLFEDDADVENESFGDYNNRRWNEFNICLKYCKDVRIWLSNTAEAYCGLYHLCAYLEKKRVNIYVVECPHYIPGKCKESFLNGWEQCNRNDMTRYISQSRKLTNGEKHIYALRWKELVEENTPLRALIGKKVVGVEEDFYDSFIRKHIPNDEVEEGKIIRDFFFEEISVHSGWIEMRIEKMIEAGELGIIKDAKDQYKRIVKRR